MFGIKELKERIEITNRSVECPVKDCNEKVERQRKTFKRESRFKCPEHNIFISPSTFEYSKESDNLLWYGGSDHALFEAIKLAKRESRIARDNSEDAVTWNVFRFLERNKLVANILSPLISANLECPELIWWSYSQQEKSSWSELNAAIREFGETPERGSEPDLIIVSNNSLVFLEAKVGAANKTVPSDKNSPKKYDTGGSGWFSKVFRSDYETIAEKEKKYELMRFWLIGTWIAQRLSKNYYLVNLVLKQNEKEIEAIFKRHIIEDQCKKFIRITWEDIYNQIQRSNLAEPDKNIMIYYFKNKSLGYRQGKLRKAFLVF